MKPTTDIDKKMKGTFRADRTRTQLTYIPLKEIPEPMETLEGAELSYFRYIAEILISQEI
jgi:hypothetical protein